MGDLLKRHSKWQLVVHFALSQFRFFSAFLIHFPGRHCG
jgi:hypothetical protein